MIATQHDAPVLVVRPHKNKMATEAVHRANRRAYAQHLGIAAIPSDMVWMEPFWKYLGKFRSDPEARATAFQLMAGAVWIEDRAAKAGYDTLGLCTFCSRPNSLQHRLYECAHPAAVAARRMSSPPP